MDAVFEPEEVQKIIDGTDPNVDYELIRFIIDWMNAPGTHGWELDLFIRFKDGSRMGPILRSQFTEGIDSTRNFIPIYLHGKWSSDPDAKQGIHNILAECEYTIDNISEIYQTCRPLGPRDVPSIQ